MRIRKGRKMQASNMPPVRREEVLRKIGKESITAEAKPTKRKPAESG
jgi:hypothetical protein